MSCFCQMQLTRWIKQVEFHSLFRKRYCEKNENRIRKTQRSQKQNKNGKRCFCSSYYLSVLLTCTYTCKKSPGLQPIKERLHDTGDTLVPGWVHFIWLWVRLHRKKVTTERVIPALVHPDLCTGKGISSRYEIPAVVPAFLLRHPRARGCVVKKLISVPHDNYLESIYVHIVYF